jgi:hypothetical protein
MLRGLKPLSMTLAYGRRGRPRHKRPGELRSPARGGAPCPHVLSYLMLTRGNSTKLAWEEE